MLNHWKVSNEHTKSAWYSREQIHQKGSSSRDSCQPSLKQYKFFYQKLSLSVNISQNWYSTVSMAVNDHVEVILGLRNLKNLQSILYSALYSVQYGLVGVTKDLSK
jgi:hypothetical protein